MFNITMSNASPERRARANKAEPNVAGTPTPRFRDYVRQLNGPQIEEQWRAHKSGFVAIASALGHALRANQLHTIWVLSWADRFAVATAKGRAILEGAFPQYQRDALMQTIHSCDDGQFYEALGPAYHHAQTEACNASFMFMHCTLAHEILRNADDAGDEFTLERLDQAVLDAGLEVLEAQRLQESECPLPTRTSTRT